MEKKDWIATECAQLFRRRSFRGTTMAEVADHLKMNKGTLYYYYPSKADILTAIYMMTLRELNNATRDLDIAETAADRALTEMIHCIVAVISEHPDIIAVYFQEHHWIDEALTAEQAAVVRTSEVEFQGTLRSIIERGVQERVFRPVNADLLAVQILSSLSSLYRWIDTSQAPFASVVADSLVGNILDGIRGRAVT